jgi:hypothetical protein
MLLPICESYEEPGYSSDDHHGDGDNPHQSSSLLEACISATVKTPNMVPAKNEISATTHHGIGSPPKIKHAALC